MINTIPTRKTAHMRGIKQAIEEIKQADGTTESEPITAAGIRKIAE